MGGEDWSDLNYKKMDLNVLLHSLVAQKDSDDRANGNQSRSSQNSKALLVAEFGKEKIFADRKDQYAEEKNNDVLRLHN